MLCVIHTIVGGWSPRSSRWWSNGLGFESLATDTHGTKRAASPVALSCFCIIWNQTLCSTPNVARRTIGKGGGMSIIPTKEGWHLYPAEMNQTGAQIPPVALCGEVGRIMTHYYRVIMRGSCLTMKRQSMWTAVRQVTQHVNKYGKRANGD